MLVIRSYRAKAFAQSGFVSGLFLVACTTTLPRSTETIWVLLPHVPSQKCEKQMSLCLPSKANQPSAPPPSLYWACRAKRKHHGQAIKSPENTKIHTGSRSEKKGSFTNPYWASQRQIIPFRLENTSYLDLLSEVVWKNTILHLSQQADFILKENSHSFCSTSCLSLQIQPRKTSVLHLQLHRTEGTTYTFAQVPFPHLQDVPLAPESLPRYCNCLWRRAVLPTKGRWGVGREAFPASSWQTISLSNWPIFYRIISPRERSTAAL